MTCCRATLLQIEKNQEFCQMTICNNVKYVNLITLWLCTTSVCDAYTIIYATIYITDDNCMKLITYLLLFYIVKNWVK